MKLNKSNSTNCLKLYNDDCSNPTSNLKSQCFNEFHLKRDESTERCHYLLSSSTLSSQSDELRNNTSFSSNSSSASNKSNYSSTSSSSSLSTNDCIIDCLNKFSLNKQTVNENKEIENITSTSNQNCDTIDNSIQNTNNNVITSNESQATSSQSTTYNSINPIKLNSLYKIQEKIRSGGFGDVYKGVRRIDNLPIAIKIVRKERINQWFVNVSQN